MCTTTIKVSETTASKINRLARDRGQSVEEITEQAVRALERQLKTMDKLDRIYQENKELMDRLASCPQ
uniref:ribbon-helix-helix protein, CopG family n=1 Tax=Vaginimicrobium propionicum TaxID=1871034 RepID=UPI000970AA93